MNDLLGSIKLNPYFNSLNADVYSKLLKSISIVQLKENEVLFSEGDFADAFYIVKDGAIRISTLNAEQKKIVLARIANNGFFGEQAFSPSSYPCRQASAAAQVATTLYKFPRQALLHLRQTQQHIQNVLQERNVSYFKEKLDKLVDNIQHSSFDIDALISEKCIFKEREVIYYQGDEALRSYILINGEVELRSYDDKNQLIQMITINQGQLFGAESLAHPHSEKKYYLYSAIIKNEAIVILIDAAKYNRTVETNPLLKQLSTNFDRQFNFKTKGKIFQFRSEYMEMPSTTSIILLNDKREIVCHQIIGMDIFLATISNCTPTQKIHFVRDVKYTRELCLSNRILIGFIDNGLWDDSHDLLDFMIDGKEMTDSQLADFAKSGHITFTHTKSCGAEFVCKCMQVSEETINKLITTNKANFDDIRQITGASTICGGCKPTILEMLGTNAWTPSIISEIIDHNAEVKSIRLTLSNQVIPLYKPGQNIVVKTKIDNVWIQRNYTLTSTPDMPYLEITVKREPNGIFSSWLFKQVCDNAIIYVSGPYGHFTVDEPLKMPIICFMGGIGITPAIGFLRQLSKQCSRHAIYIDYSVCTPDQFILHDEFERLSKGKANIAINHRITSINGILTEREVHKIILSIDDCNIYVCGPKGFESLISNTCKKMKLAPERLHVEEFIHAGSPQNAPQTISLE